MNTNTLRRIAPFLVLTLLFVASLAVSLGWYGKGNLHLLLNTWHAPCLDYMMRFFTAVAEYGVYVMIVVFLFRKAGYSVVVAAGGLLSTLITQAVKHIVEAPRPMTWFAENMPDIRLVFVEGVEVHKYLSFPSGHTTAAFALATALVYVVECSTRLQEKPRARRAWQIVLFLLAAAAGYSRIYLSQHFALDVLTGCSVGTLSSLFVCWLADRLQLPKRQWWQWHISFSRNKTE